MADFTETLKKLGEYNPKIYLIFLISAMKLPNIIIDLSPFLILFASLFTIRTLVIKKEVDIFKACGLSIWQFIRPFLVVISLYSLIIIFGITTLASICNKQIDVIENQITNKDSNTLYINDNILWIVDRINKYNKNIIMAKNFNSTNNIWYLEDVKVLQIKNNVLLNIYQSQNAQINSNILTLNNVLVKGKEDRFIEYKDNIDITINSKSTNISNIMADPNQISMFQYPIFLYNFKKLGLDSSSYENYFYNILTLPILLLSMLFVSIYFSIYDSRRGKNLTIITSTIVFGFIIYFSINFIVALASSSHIPNYLSIIFAKLTITLITLYFVIKKEGI
jgi:lipopolysaccharide export system permease protein